MLSERRKYATISLKAERLTDRIAFTSESNELLTALTSNYSPNEVRLRSLPLSKADRYPIGFEKGKKVTRREGTEWLPTACRVFFPDLLVFPTERNSRSKRNSILLIKILLILLLNIEYRIEYSIQRKPPLPPIKIKIFLLAHFFLFNRSLLAFLYERPTELTKNLNGLVWASRLSISSWTDALVDHFWGRRYLATAENRAAESKQKEAETEVGLRQSSL